MNWTTASMDLNDDQARTRSIDMNQFTVQRGESLYKSIKLNTSIILMVTVLSLSLFPSASHGGSFLLYSTLWTILIQHLLVI